MLDSRPKGRGFEPHRRHCVVSLSKNINPSLVLVHPGKTRPFITERLLMGSKESNQTNKSGLSPPVKYFTDRSKAVLLLWIFYEVFYTPPHFSVEVLCYTFRCLCVCLSVRPCSPFPIDNLSIYSRNFFKFCIHIVIGDEWYGIVNGQNPSIFNGVTALFRIGKMVSGLLFLYCL